MEIHFDIALVGVQAAFVSTVAWDLINISVKPQLMVSGSEEVSLAFLINSKHRPSLVLRPFPLKKMPGTHRLHMCEIAIFSVKALWSSLSDYTSKEYRAFFAIDSSTNLSCRTLLGYYFSDVAASFFQTYSPTER